jgi:SAM-dependent methyltransferase
MTMTTVLRVAARSERDPRLRPWSGHSPLRPMVGAIARRHRCGCNICAWHGTAFIGFAHSESAQCPRCHSISRDRFLYHCWTSRTRYRSGLRLLETSPRRMGDEYQDRMASLTEYLATDYDEWADPDRLDLDLQNLDLPDDSLDVVLTSHVLEHVPDTGRALSELHRVIAPGGVAYVMVPLTAARTAPPATPEFHNDETPVFWRFGWDFADVVAAAGFTVSTLVTADLLSRAQHANGWGYVGPDVDSDSVLDGARQRTDSLTVVADVATSRWFGFDPSFFFVAWECRR